MQPFRPNDSFRSFFTNFSLKHDKKQRYYRDEQTFQDDINKLLQTGEFSDFTIYVVNDASNKNQNNSGPSNSRIWNSRKRLPTTHQLETQGPSPFDSRETWNTVEDGRFTKRPRVLSANSPGSSRFAPSVNLFEDSIHLVNPPNANSSCLSTSGDVNIQTLSEPNPPGYEYGIDMPKLRCFSPTNQPSTSDYDSVDSRDSLSANILATFHVHKSILAARSPVFAALLRSNMVESNADCVHINDLSVGTVEAMLHYLYHDCVSCVQIERSLYGELMRAADKYDIQGLGNICEDVLLADLNVENCCETLLLAESASASRLFSECKDFIHRNAGQVIHSPQFQSLMYSSALPQLYKDMVEQKNSIDFQVMKRGHMLLAKEWAQRTSQAVSTLYDSVKQFLLDSLEDYDIIASDEEHPSPPTT